MAALVEEARVPLLASQNSEQDELDELKDDFDVHYTVKGGKRSQLQGWAGPDQSAAEVGRNSHLSRGEGGGRGLRRVGSEQSAVSRPRRKQQYTGSEMIVAVFVVAFDTKKGELKSQTKSDI